jgi:hypothetical protein
MTEQLYGIKETGDVLTAAGDLAVIVYKAKKEATGPDGRLDVSKLSQAIATELMMQPAVLDDLKAAADNVSDVPKELKDLSLAEVFQLLTVAGGVAAKCAAEIAS